MKWFRYILAIYLLALTVVPCVDGRAHEHEGPDSQICMGHHGYQEDACSPFCACACCRVNITQTRIPYLAHFEMKLSACSFVQEPDVWSIPSDIWQPPRV